MNSANSSPRSLRNRVLVRLLGGLLVLGAMFFLPAGTLFYWQAWVFMVVMFVPVILFGAYLLKRNPELLEKRLNMRERESQQRGIIAVSTLVLLAAFLLPGFDVRYGWSAVPVWLVIFADLMILLGYLLFVLTLRENEFASRTIEVQQEQKVISTGPYSLVRHPMYLAVSLIFIFSPLALGSYWALIPAAIFPLVLVARILNEEQVLLRDLDGYADYRKEVRYRLIPGIW
jgi:protein-S-isoprenylcysteine O-methyltransferase Ste14